MFGVVWCVVVWEMVCDRVCGRVYVKYEGGVEWCEGV